MSFTGIVHPGLMGTAPSAELLAKWNAREQALIDTDPQRVPPLALPPLPGLGDPRPLTGADFDSAAGEAARTGCRARRRQPGHQEPHEGLPGLLPGVRAGREPVDGRSNTQPTK